MGGPVFCNWQTYGILVGDLYKIICYTILKADSMESWLWIRTNRITASCLSIPRWPRRERAAVGKIVVFVRYNALDLNEFTLQIGGGVLGDCWLPHERGQAVAIFSLAPLL